MNITWPSDAVRAMWQDGTFRRGCTEPWTAHLVASVAQAINARTIVETGTFLGTTTAFLADALPRAQIISLDISPHNERITPASNVTYRAADALAWLRECDQRPFIDFAFIDDDHDAGHVAKELDAIMPLMNNGGVICLHDVIGPFGLDSLVRSRGGYCIELPLLHVAGGLGIIQIKL